MNEKVILRDATIEDAPMIAWTMMESGGMSHAGDERIRMSAANEECLYSYRFARVAEINGKVVGCQIAYTGEEYARLRRYTFRFIWPYVSDELIDSSPMEVDADEYHLESMAVLPEYRGRGISRLLIMDSVGIGRSKGYRHIAFLVDLGDAGMQAYYRRLGFVDEREIHLYKHDYIKMKYVG